MYQFLLSKVGKPWADVLIIIIYLSLLLAILIGLEYDQGTFRYLDW